MITPRMATLAALAEEQVPAGTDLWPGIWARLQAPAQRQSQRAIAARRGWALGGVALLLVLSVAFVAVGPASAWAQVQRWLAYVSGTDSRGYPAGQNAPERPLAVADQSGGAIVAWIQGQRILVVRLGGAGEASWQTTLGARAGSAWLLPDGAGGVIVIWMDHALAASGEDVYAQRLSAAGKALWQEGGVPLRVVPGPQVVRGVACDGAGGAFVFWRDMHSAPYGLYAQHIDGEGRLAFAEDGVLLAVGPGSGYETASAVSDGLGGAIVAWQGGPGDAERPLALSLQRVDSRGLPLWGENGIVLATGEDVTASSISPQLAPDGAGGAVVAWQDGQGQLRAERIDAQGQQQWREVTLSAGPIANGFELQADGQGGFLAVWAEPPWGNASLGQWALHAQKLGLDGVAAWGASALLLTPSTENMYQAGAVTDGHGGATVVWRSGVSPSQEGSIRLQHLDRDGGPTWPAEGVALYAQGSQYQGYPTIVSDGAGGATAVFLLGRSAGDAVPYAQRVGPAGSLLWPQGAVSVYR